MQKKQILLDGKILNYYDNSFWKKQWVFVFLHGWMQDWTSFVELFELFEKEKIPYISLDLPGFGSSALLHDNMTIEEYGSVVSSCIEKLHIIQPVLVWHSFGGRISIYLWSFYTNLEKIILIWSAGIAPQMNPLKLLIIKLGKSIFSLPLLKWIWERMKNAISGVDYKNAGKMTQVFKNTISNDLRNYMIQISLPTLMIWWDADDQVPIDEAKTMYEHIKHSDLHILKWTHFIHKERPEEIMNLILNFR